jgi:hypothetical protein
LRQASELIGRSYRRTKRIWAQYQAAGPAGLKHGNAGRRSNRTKPERFRQKVLRLVKNKYRGTEKLALEVNAERLGSELDSVVRGIRSG